MHLLQGFSVCHQLWIFIKFFKIRDDDILHINLPAVALVVAVERVRGVRGLGVGLEAGAAGLDGTAPRRQTM